MQERCGFKKMSKYEDEMSSLKVKCECSHTMVIPKRIDSVICSYCKKRVYRTPEIEFREKMKREIRKGK